MSRITLLGDGTLSPCSNICTGGCGTVACQDCTLGEHTVAGADFWAWVANFTPPIPAAPVSMSISDIQAALANTSCKTGVVVVSFDPDLKYNIQNITTYIGAPQPIIPADAQHVPLSIILFYAIVSTYVNAASFNFYIGCDQHGTYFPLFNVTDSFGQVIYYADMSGLIP